MQKPFLLGLGIAYVILGLVTTEWIIGPLRKTSVQAMTELGGLGLPVLALNTIDAADTAVRRENLLFSLSLSQEAEARAIARRALQNGWTSAIMLTSQNSWGQRMETAFGDEYVSGGGKITANAQFEPAENDHSELLTGLLKISESTDRKNRVQATLGISLNFEPIRRDDFDLFFLAATPVQGRQLRPQLRFHDAGDKPVLAMGRIYAGASDRIADRDLNGIFFPGTQWQLDQAENPESPDLASLRGGNLASLHALGIDAWNLLPWLPLMRKDTDLHYPGAVGSLFMNQHGRLLREPAWARFSRGRPVPAEWATLEN